MTLVALSKDQYGTFFNSDSYVILASAVQGQFVGVDSVVRFIYFLYSFKVIVFSLEKLKE